MTRTPHIKMAYVRGLFLSLSVRTDGQSLFLTDTPLGQTIVFEDPDMAQELGEALISVAEYWRSQEFKDHLEKSEL